MAALAGRWWSAVDFIGEGVLKWALGTAGGIYFCMSTMWIDIAIASASASFIVVVILGVVVVKISSSTGE